MDQQYKSNSHKDREARKVGKVVSGSVSQKKKTGLRKLADTFFTNDVDSISEHILMDIVIPTAKSALMDALAMLLGEQRGSRSGSSVARVSYRDCYDQNNSRRSVDRNRGQSMRDFDDISYQTRGDAEEVLYQLQEMIDEFGRVSVGDLYDMSGITCDYQCYKYGWSSLTNAYVERTRSGEYMIHMPRPLYLD